MMIVIATAVNRCCYSMQNTPGDDLNHDNYLRELRRGLLRRPRKCNALPEHHQRVDNTRPALLVRYSCRICRLLLKSEQCPVSRMNE